MGTSSNQKYVFNTVRTQTNFGGQAPINKWATQIGYTGGGMTFPSDTRFFPHYWQCYSQSDTQPATYKVHACLFDTSRNEIERDTFGTRTLSALSIAGMGVADDDISL